MMETPSLEDARDPYVAAWPWRVWGVRHVRWWFCQVRARLWARGWAQHGIGLGELNPSDAAVLDAIWRGER